MSESSGRFEKDISIHVEMLVDDEMREHAGAHPTEHDLSFQIFRLLGGYRRALDELDSRTPAPLDLESAIKSFEQSNDWSLYKDYEKRDMAFRAGFDLAHLTTNGYREQSSDKADAYESLKATVIDYVKRNQFDYGTLEAGWSVLLRGATAPLDLSGVEWSNSFDTTGDNWAYESDLAHLTTVQSAQSVAEGVSVEELREELDVALGSYFTDEAGSEGDFPCPADNLPHMIEAVIMVLDRLSKGAR